MLILSFTTREELLTLSLNVEKVLGAIELPPFDVGTKAVAIAVAEATHRGAHSVIGGGDSASAVEKLDLLDRISHNPTGGGASLDFLESKKFNCIKILGEN